MVSPLLNGRRDDGPSGGGLCTEVVEDESGCMCIQTSGSSLSSSGGSSRKTADGAQPNWAVFVEMNDVVVVFGLLIDLNLLFWEKSLLL